MKTVKPRTVKLNSEADTRKLGLEIANALEPGDVVALIGDEATVKRIYFEKDHIRLQPENDAFEPILVKEVTILGKVVSLVRYF